MVAGGCFQHVAWRARQYGLRVYAARRQVWLTALAGGLGGGVGLGALRAATAGLAHAPVLPNALSGAALGAWVNFALLWGVWMAALLFVEPPRAIIQKALAALSISLLGGAAFGLAASLGSLLAGMLRLPGGEMALAANFEAGVCLALAFAFYPFWRAGAALPFSHGLWRALAAGGLYVTLHHGFVRMGISYLSAAVIWPGALFREGLHSAPVWLRGTAGMHWYDALALLDAFLAGALLCAGIMAGLRLAVRRPRGSGELLQEFQQDRVEEV